MSRSSHFLVACILVILAITLPGCSDQRSEQQPEPVVIGVVYPLSGDLAEKGLDCSRGISLAVDDINAAGGIKSLGGAEILAVMADSAGSPETGMQETERLITEQGAIAVIGAYQSSVTRTATQVAERLRTPFIVDSAIADSITERGFDYTFRIGPKSEFYGQAQVRFLLDLQNIVGYEVRKIALIHENTDYGTAAALAQKEAITRNNLEMVVESSYVAAGVTDLGLEVEMILAAQPDAILEATYLADSILIRQALADAGSQVPLIDTAGGTVSPEYVERLGPLAEGSFSVVEYSPYIESCSALNSRYRERFGVEITGESAHAYQAVWVIKDALERSAVIDRERLRDALAQTNMEPGPQMILPAERLRFDSSGQNEFAPLFIAQVQDGLLKPVWPEAYANTAVRWER